MKKLKEIQDAVSRVCGTYEPEESFRAGVVLLASASIGTNVKKLASFTKIPIQQIREFEKNLIKQGIWIKGKINHSNWFDKKNGGVGFNCDVACATGLLERKWSPK